MNFRLMRYALDDPKAKPFAPVLKKVMKRFFWEEKMRRNIVRQWDDGIGSLRDME